jgi:hypothetical protein
MGGGFQLVLFVTVFSIETKSDCRELVIQLAKKHIIFQLCKKSNYVSKKRKFRASKSWKLVYKTENITLMNHDTVEVLGDEQVVTGVEP